MSKANDYPETRRSATEPKAAVRDTFAVGRARPPGHLDKVAKKLFRRLAARLTTAGVLRDVDEFGLGELCQAQSDVMRLTNVITEEGEFLKGPNDGKVWNPKLGLLKDARRRVKEWSDRLGMSIKARAHMKFPAGTSPDRPTDDELEKFFRGEGWNNPEKPNHPAPFTGASA